MTFLHDPFFWALISMFGLVGAGAVVSGKKLGRYALFGLIIVVIFDLGRVILVLPTCPQPRFETGGWHWVVGAVIFAMGLIVRKQTTACGGGFSRRELWHCRALAFRPLPGGSNQATRYAGGS